MKSLALILGSLVLLTATLAEESNDNNTTAYPNITTVEMTSLPSNPSAHSSTSQTVSTVTAMSTQSVPHATETTNSGNSTDSTNSTSPTVSPTVPSGAPLVLGSFASCLLLSSVLSLALL